MPVDHLLRQIDRFLDLASVRRELAGHYSNIGRPSIDPDLMIRVLIVGYCFAIRSERRLCEEVHLNLAYRWFCGLGLDGKVPNHSTSSRNRHGRFRDSNILRHLFESVVRRCMAEGLVGGEGFAVDASLIQADATILGLLGESRQSDHFSFLTDKTQNRKFRQKGFAENFVGTLIWESGAKPEKRLDQDVEPCLLRELLEGKAVAPAAAAGLISRAFVEVGSLAISFAFVTESVPFGERNGR